MRSDAAGPEAEFDESPEDIRYRNIRYRSFLCQERANRLGRTIGAGRGITSAMPLCRTTATRHPRTAAPALRARRCSHRFARLSRLVERALWESIPSAWR